MIIPLIGCPEKGIAWVEVCTGAGGRRTIWWRSVWEARGFDLFRRRHDLFLSDQCSGQAEFGERLAWLDFIGLLEGKGNNLSMWVLEDDENGVWSRERRIMFPSE